MKPHRIFLVRHGQSIGNVDKKKYNKIPDFAITLTELGDEQTIQTGKNIKAVIGNETVGVECSPYYRTRRSWKNMEQAFDKSQIKYYKEDLRIREHEFAAQLIDQNKSDWEEQADSFGVTFFRFTTGESGADTFDRACGWRQDLFRKFEAADYPKNLIVCGHGMTNRIILMDFLDLTVDEFELLKNPRNGEFFTLVLKGDKYVLDTPARKREKLHRKW